jgi:hypothetical protein
MALCANGRTAGKKFYLCGKPNIGSTQHLIYAVTTSDGTLNALSFGTGIAPVLTDLTVIESTANKTAGQSIDTATDTINMAYDDGAGNIQYFQLDVDGNGNWDGVIPDIETCTYATTNCTISGQIFGNHYDGIKYYNDLIVYLITGASSPYSIVEETECAAGLYSITTGLASGTKFSICVPNPKFVPAGTITAADMRGYLDLNQDNVLDKVNVWGQTRTFAGQAAELTPQYVNDITIVRHQNGAGVGSNTRYTDYHLIFRNRIAQDSRLEFWFVQNRQQELNVGQKKSNMAIALSTAQNLDTFQTPINYFENLQNQNSGNDVDNYLSTAHLNSATPLRTFLTTYFNAAAEGLVGNGVTTCRVAFVENKTGNLVDWIANYIGSGGTTFDAAHDYLDFGMTL